VPQKPKHLPSTELNLPGKVVILAVAARPVPALPTIPVPGHVTLFIPFGFWRMVLSISSNDGQVGINCVSFGGGGI